MRWFKIWGVEWLTGTTHDELTPVQRALWIDCLARASVNDPPGSFRYHTFKQLEDQFKIPIAEIASGFITLNNVGKISHDEIKKTVKICKWSKYQRELKSQAGRNTYNENSDDTPQSYHINSHEKRGEEKRGEEIRKELKAEPVDTVDNSKNPMTQDQIQSRKNQLTEQAKILGVKND